MTGPYIAGAATKVATAAEWAASRHPLSTNRLGVASDTGVMKVGDGRSLWADLPVLPGGGGGGFTPVSFILETGDTQGGNGIVFANGEGTLPVYYENIVSPDDPFDPLEELPEGCGITWAADDQPYVITFAEAGVYLTRVGFSMNQDDNAVVNVQFSVDDYWGTWVSPEYRPSNPFHVGGGLEHAVHAIGGETMSIYGTARNLDTGGAGVYQPVAYAALFVTRIA